MLKDVIFLPLINNKGTSTNAIIKGVEMEGTVALKTVLMIRYDNFRGAISFTQKP